MLDRQAMLLGQPLGDQRAVACLGVALDTQQRCDSTARQRRHDRREVSAVEDLRGVPAYVLGSELAVRALADPLAVVLGVLRLTQLSSRGELEVMFARDPSLGEGRLQPTGLAGCVGREGLVGYVFISYSRGDHVYVQRLVEHLLAHGIESWFDYRLVPGDSFGSRIQAAIDHCDALLVVLTPEAIASSWVRREIVYADSRKKPILPLLLADCEKPIELITLHHEDVRGGQMASAAFMAELRAIVSARPAALTVVTPHPSPQGPQRASHTPNSTVATTTPRPPRRRVLCVSNPRGGVGKTTTVVNLAVTLAMYGNRVLVIDLDPEGNASAALCVPHHPDSYHCLVADTPISDVVQRVDGIPNLLCVPASTGLADAETELVSMVLRESRLANLLNQHKDQYDYVLIDCPSSLGLLTVNALVAAQEVMIPIQCDSRALESVQQLSAIVQTVKHYLNPALEVSTVLLTMFDHTEVTSAIQQDVRARFGERVLAAVIPRDARVSEAAARGQSVVVFDPHAPGAIGYSGAAVEIATRWSHVGATG